MTKRLIWFFKTRNRVSFKSTIILNQNYTRFSCAVFKTSVISHSEITLVAFGFFAKCGWMLWMFLCRSVLLNYNIFFRKQMLLSLIVILDFGRKCLIKQFGFVWYKCCFLYREWWGKLRGCFTYLMLSSFRFHCIVIILRPVIMYFFPFWPICFRASTCHC